jgi:putative ABC transport system permease protein
VQFVSPGYFSTLGVPLRRGRLLDARDDGRDGISAVVNETMARTLWPGGAVGQRFRFPSGANEPPNPWMTVVGVVGDVRMAGPGAEPVPQWITTTGAATILGGAPRNMWLLARTHAADGGDADPTRIVPAARQALRALDPELNFGRVQTVDAVLSDAVAGPRFTMLLLVSFGLVALGLAAVGIYGVLAYLVAQRTRELGIRMALGAQRGDVLLLVVKQGLALAAVGILAGLAGSLLSSQLLRGLLFQTAPRDPLIFTAIALVLAAVAALASWLPARRATRVDPVIALRES